MSQEIEAKMKLYWREISNPVVLRYIHQVFGWGTTLPQLLAAQLELSKGEVFTFVPPEMSQAELMPVDPSMYDTWIQLPDPILHRQLFIQYLETYLTNNPGGICVLAETLLRAGESMSEDEHRTHYLYGEDVYFMFTEDQRNRIDIPQLIRAVLKGRGAVVVFTSLPDGLQGLAEDKNLTKEQLQALAQSTIAFAVGAYDGAGVLIWEKLPG